MNFPPKGIDEEGNFDKMIERLSLELLGFSFSEKTTNSKYNEIILPLIKGLSIIIKSIYYSLKITENESLNDSFVCPKRKNIPMRYRHLCTKFWKELEYAVEKQDSFKVINIKIETLIKPVVPFKKYDNYNEFLY